MAYPTLVITQGSGAGTTANVPDPGVQPGELVIVSLATNSNSALSNLPAGWTLANSVAPTSSYDRQTVVWAKAENATWPLTATIAAARDQAWHVIRVQNWDTSSTPQFVFSNRAASGTTVNVSSITPSWGTADAIDIITVARTNPAVGQATSPTGYSNFIDSSVNTTSVGTAVQIASTNSNLNPTGTKTVTNADSGSLYTVCHMLVKGSTVSAGTTYPISGTSSAVSATGGDVSVAPATVGLSGSATAVSAVSSANVSAQLTVTASVAATSATSGSFVPPPSTGGSRPTQQEMPVNPFSSFEETPTYTWNTSSGPMSAPYQWKDATDSLIRLTANAANGTVAGEAEGFVRPPALDDISGAGTGTNAMVVPAYGIRVRTDSQDIYFRLRQRDYSGQTNVSNRASIRLKVNNKWTQLDPVYLGSPPGYPSNPSNISAGEYFLKVSFSSAVMRDVELTTHLSFGGLAVNSGAAMVVPAKPKYRMAVIGASLDGGEKHQTGNFALSGGSTGTYTAITSYAMHSGYALGYDEILNLATGSSGYGIFGDTVKWNYPSKLNETISFAPNTVTIGSPNNDITQGRSVAQVNSDAQSVLSTLRSNLPDTLIVVLGALAAPAMGSQVDGEALVAPYNNALQSLCQTYGAWFINPATGQTIDPSGTVRKTTSNWTFSGDIQLSSDNVHPTQVGARSLGIKYADAIRMAHDEGGTTTPTPSALAGTSSASSTTLGLTTANRVVSGASSAVSASVGSIVKATVASGEISAVSTASGAFIKNTSSEGISSSVSDLVGSFVRSTYLDGVALSASYSEGGFTKASPLDGSIASYSEVGGNVAGETGLAGVSAVISESLGSISKSVYLSGLVTGLSSTSGSAEKTTSASGASSGVSGTSGVYTNIARISGTAIGAISTTQGVASARLRVSGTTNGVASTGGSLLGKFQISGQVVSTSEASAASPGAGGSLSGRTAASSTTAGSPTATSVFYGSWRTGFEEGTTPFTSKQTPLTTEIYPTPGAKTGTKVLRDISDVAAHRRYWDSTQVVRQGDVVSTWVRISAAASTPALGGISLQNASGDGNRFSILIDPRNLSASSAGFQIRDNELTGADNATGTLTGEVPIDINRWYRIEAWFTSTTVEGRLYDDTGLRLASLSRVPVIPLGTLYYPGVYAYRIIEWDDYSITRGVPYQDASSVSSGSFAKNSPMSSAVQSTASTFGAISGSLSVLAESSGASAAFGGVTKQSLVAATSPAVGGSAGTVLLLRKLAGVVSAISAVQGRTQIGYQLLPPVVADSEVSGAFSLGVSVGGVVTTASDTEGVLSTLHTALGQVSSFSNSSGEYSLFVGVAGVITSESATTGEATKAATLGGVVPSESDVSGRYNLGHIMSGTVAGISEAAATLAYIITLYLKIGGVELPLTAGSLSLRNAGQEDVVGLATTWAGNRVTLWETPPS